jgi:Domain of unknown function (DUF4111)/Nucleotidyltransferase domain
MTFKAGGPTRFADLNEVLRELVGGARAALGDNFCGSYLVGSFAVGDADEHSDVDFLVVTCAEVSAEQEAHLRVMHARFPTLGVSWAQHLEGSYVPKAALRRLDPSRTAWLYVNNGSAEMELSSHDNNGVVRWSLREHGLVLAGPDPKELVDPVTADDLRHEAFEAIAVRAADPWSYDNGWAQPYVVATFCRMLNTLQTGQITSKRKAMEWAQHALDEEWTDLIESALRDRPNTWALVHQPAHPGSVDRTRRFVAYVLSAGSRPAEPMR